MLARTNGNMGEVYRECVKRAEATMVEIERKGRLLEAEITEGSIADWYLLHTFPGDDARAMRWLARRRFGVFRPLQQKTDKRNGTAVQGWEQVFPGWVFVYVWDIEKLKSRLLACPGVMGIFCDPIKQKPIRVDQVGKDGIRFIDKLRSLSWVYEDNAPRLQRHQPSAWRAAPKKTSSQRRPTKPERKTLDKLKNTLKKQGNWDASTWESANELAPHQRIALLQRYLHGSAVVGDPRL